MKTTIQSINFNADQKLLNLIGKKILKLKTFFSNIYVINVFLYLENNRLKTNKKIEILLRLKQKSIVVKKSSNTFESATYQIIDTLKKQLIKQKEKKKN